MRYLICALAGAALMVGCDKTDPTAKEDMSCTAQFEDVTQAKACSQLHITSAEGLVAKEKCEGDLGGTWTTNPCTADNRVAGGYCKVEASRYSLSGTDVKVYFYSPVTLDIAKAACAGASPSGTWITE